MVMLRIDGLVMKEIAHCTTVRLPAVQISVVTTQKIPQLVSSD